MAKEWQKILDDFSSGKSSTSQSTSSPAQASTSKNTSSNNWQGILDNFSGSSRKKQYNDAIAPVASRVITRAQKKKEEEKKKERKWFEKGLFEDGYDIGDVTRTILGSAVDALENVGSGIIGMGEKAVDSMAYIAPYAANGQFYQNGGIYTLEQQEQHEKVVEQSKKDLGKFIAKDLYDEEKIARAIISDPARKIGIDSESHSVFGEKSDSLIQSGGQLLATAGLAAAGLPWWATTGVTSFGSEAENAMNQGATYEQAGASAAISAGAEILSEKLSGGISFGGKTLDDALTKQLARGISNKLGRTAAKLGLDMAGEGAEEVFSQIASNVGSSLYKEENLKELLTSEEAMEEYLESFIGGAALGGVSNTFNAVKSNSKGVDYTSGLTANEDAVIRKVYNDRVEEAEKNGKLTEKQKSEIYDKVLSDMDKGYLSIDDIESALGGQTYEDYKRVSEWEDGLQKEFDELHAMKRGEMTGEQLDREAHLKEQLKNVKATSSRDALKSKLSEDVFGLVKGDRLIESYNERTRRGQVFEADLSKYDAKQQATIQKAIDSGILNNTNRTHEFVDIISKISADKGVLFDFTNNKKLKESGFAIDGKQVNGFVTKDGISINIDSPKAWQSTVGHEVTHVLEGTEFYTELQNTLFEYAKTKGEYDSRMKSLTELYKDVKDADINAELTADLVGEYLFTEENFIKNLSTQNRNVFQKIYDEIKYLVKVATGSKEAKELEKVKRAFDKAYREGGKAQSDTKYSITTETDTAYTDAVKRGDTEKAQMMVDEAAKALGYSYRGVHRTNSDFTVFDRNKIGGNAGTQFGDAFYVSLDIKDSATAKYADSAYGKKKMDLYVKMQSPLKLGTAISEETVNRMQNDLEWFGDDTSVRYGVSPDTVREQLISGDNYEQMEAIRWLSDENNLQISELLKRYGFDGIISENEYVSQAAVFDENQLKSADSVTYDDSGKVIPLSQRFNAVDKDIRYSLSDSDGKQLTKEQQEYFKDSKARDENGSLKLVYHSSPTAGFTVFDGGEGHGNYKFGEYSDGVTFFTDNKAMADSYSPSDEKVDTKKLNNLDDAREWLGDISAGYVEIRDNNGKLEVFDSDDDSAILEYDSEEELLRNLKRDMQEELGDPNAGGQYEGYVNLKNPLIVDAEGRPWSRVTDEFSQEVYDKFQSLTEEEKAALIDLAEWEDFSLFMKEINQAAAMYDAGYERDYYKLCAGIVDKMLTGEVSTDYYNLFDVAADAFAEETIREKSVVQLSTNDYVERALKDGSYDGVIIKNVIDYGGHAHSTLSSPPGNDYIVFNSNQFKAADNLKPTDDADIRYSLSKEGEQFGKTGQFATPATELRYEAPVAEESSVVAPVAENATTTPTVAENSTVQPETQLTEENSTVTADDMSALFPNNAVPVQEELEQLLTERDQLYGALEIAVDRGSAAEVGKLSEEYEALNSRIKALESKEAERTGSITDADAPEEMDAPISMKSENYDPYSGVTLDDINRNYRTYSDRNPGARQYIEEAALGFAYDVNNSTHGERWYNDELYYATGGEKGFGGTSRSTTEDIADLKDSYGYTWEQLRKAADDVIKGEVRSVAAKRVEYLVHKRLIEGYTDVDGRRYEPNRNYITFLNEQFADEQRAGNFDSLLSNADQYAPYVEEAAPVKTLKETTADTLDAPIFESTDKNAANGQTAMFAPELL